MKKYKGHTRAGLKADMRQRSKENWERGNARRIGNPRYKPVVRNGIKRYILRIKAKKK